MKLYIGEQLKALRKEKQITQEVLADVLGVSYQSVSRWELGVCYPDMELLPSIANYFGVTIDRLLSNDA
ncbi:MAG: helix-turn-helix transcriptional regulator, partial [Bacteroidales bacterium]|nr:helix-turn-helix transcriptional regulator [Bacteroidales bacterium]